MCSATDCSLEGVALVDVAFPPEATHSAAHNPDDELTQHPIPTQRLEYCIRHAAELGLEGPLTAAVAAPAGEGHPFADGHAFADSWSWVASHA